jgi:hypothetical protein
MIHLGLGLGRVIFVLVIALFAFALMRGRLDVVAYVHVGPLILVVYALGVMLFLRLFAFFVFRFTGRTIFEAYNTTITI